MQVRELIRRDVVVLRCSDPIQRFVDALGSNSQDVFPVLDEQDRVIGTVSEIELLQVLQPTQRTFAWGPRKLMREGLVRDVEDIMTPRPASAQMDEPVEEALRRMGGLSVPQLVVIDKNRQLIGLLRAQDIYQAMLGGKE